jgi:hypothetical protein
MTENADQIRWRLNAKKDRTPPEEASLAFLKLGRRAERVAGGDYTTPSDEFVETMFEEAAKNTRQPFGGVFS